MNLSHKVTGSAFNRVYNCPGSIALSIGLPPEQPRDYAVEGTAAHELAAKLIVGCDLKEITESNDMIENVMEYVDYVRMIRDNLVGKFQLIVERRLYLWPDKADISPSGQLDCLIISGQDAWIIDLKYGIGQPVTAVGNYQMAFYAALVRANFDNIKRIHTAIVQPRVMDVFDVQGVVTSATLTYQTVDAWRRKIEETVKEVESGVSIEVGSWCQYCPAKGRCPAYTASTQLVSLGSDKFDIDKIIPGELSNDEVQKIAQLLSLKKKVSSWFEKAEELLLQMAIHGREIPGYQLADKRANRIWNPMLSEAELAEKLKERGIEDPYNHKLITPAQAEKQADVLDLWEKPTGGKTLKLVK